MEELAEGPRARYRKQVRDEIQTRAWEQISRDGVSALSLKAVATQMGMTAPALYRYYSSRDELLTELILSAYRDLAERVEAAVDGSLTPGQQLTDVADAMREWAVAQPHRYLLLYGTPVPGYHAPDAATALARRIFAPVLAGFARAGDDTGRNRPSETEHNETDASGTEHSGTDPSGTDPSATDQSPAFHRSITFWTRLHGVLSLELAGHFEGMEVDARQLYQDEIDSVVPGRSWQREVSGTG